MPALLDQRSVKEVLNISAYKFVKLDSLEVRRAALLNLCKSLALKGTILLSSEGINLFLAGAPNAIDQFVDSLRREPEFADLEPKRSLSESQPFRRLLVRLKKEIIAFGVESVCPEVRTSPKLTAQELKEWLDQGRPVRLLDVRNTYEVQLGTFANAEQLHIDHFKEFPQAIEKLPEQAKQEPLVMFCTGGIRCEKAGPMMEQAGFKQVYQLDGGILKYFENCGGSHYQGSCFVFDGRVALDPHLQPTGDVLCFACQAVLSPAETQSEKFVVGKHCPRCYTDPLEVSRRRFAQRQSLILQTARAQLGRRPYDNVRRMYVPGKLAGLTMIEYLTAYHPPISGEQWQEWLRLGRITDEQGQPVAAEATVREGQCFEHHMPDTVEPDINPEIGLLYEDDWLVVVDKPAPLPVHPSGRYNRHTLLSILDFVYPNEKLRVAHRLDANTTGVMILCRSHHAARMVQPQFNQGKVDKVYLARVVGHPEWTEMTCEAAISDVPQQVGSRMVVREDSLGHAAVTEFRCLQHFADGTSLVEARPMTGRTNQIRIHLSALGFPVLGDPLYGSDRRDGALPTLAVEDCEMCLHASRISFEHPADGARREFNSPSPAWVNAAGRRQG
jgi:RluA family pseudouridine synthase